MLKLSAFTAAAILAGAAAQAATVSFTTPNWVDQNNVTSPVQYDVVIDDTTTAGAYHFDVTVNNASAQTGDALLFAFNSIFDEAADFSLTGFMSNTTDTITQICYDQIGCNSTGGSNGGGGNFGNGNAFDMIIRIGTNGAGQGSGLNTSFSFDLNYIGTDFPSLPDLAAFTFTRAGMRVQTVGDAPDGGEGSLKIFNNDPEFDDPEINEVPLPAAGWMLLAGIGGLAAARRRRKV